MAYMPDIAEVLALRLICPFIFYFLFFIFRTFRSCLISLWSTEGGMDALQYADHTTFETSGIHPQNGKYWTRHEQRVRSDGNLEVHAILVIATGFLR